MIGTTMSYRASPQSIYGETETWDGRIIIVSCAPRHATPRQVLRQTGLLILGIPTSNDIAVVQISTQSCARLDTGSALCCFRNTMHMVSNSRPLTHYHISFRSTRPPPSRLDPSIQGPVLPDRITNLPSFRRLDLPPDSRKRQFCKSSQLRPNVSASLMVHNTFQQLHRCKPDSRIRMKQPQRQIKQTRMILRRDSQKLANLRIVMNAIPESQIYPSALLMTQFQSS